MMAFIKLLLALSQIIILYHLMGVSAEERRHAAVTVTQPELQVLQESLNIISSEMASMKTIYEENQALLFSRLEQLQTTVILSNLKANELKQQLDEHKLDVSNKLEDIKTVMIQDHAIMKTHSLNVFNNMVELMVDIRMQHRLQNNILNEVKSVSGNINSLKTNAVCEDEEINCPDCSDNGILNRTIIFPDSGVPNNVPVDVETLEPRSAFPPPPPPPPPPGPPLAPAIIPPPPPPPPEPTTTTKSTTTTLENETNHEDCNAPFFRLKATGECMVVSVTKRTWMDAQNSCLKIGAYLAVPEDPRVLHAYMGQAGGYSYYYLGAHNKPGEFRWLNGTLVDRRYWRPHSPSSSYPGRLCVAYTQSGSGNKLLWANKATLCDTGLRYNFICEK